MQAGEAKGARRIRIRNARQAGDREAADGRRAARAAERIERLFSQHPQKRVFGIRAAIVEFDGAAYYVPRYGAHRPVARCTLRRKYVSQPLHDLVEAVMIHRPGSMVHAGTFFGDMIPSFSRKTPGMLYAFEPVLENYLMARAATTHNELENVMLHHAGLGAAPALAKVETGRRLRHRGGSSHVISDQAKRTVCAQPISLMSIDQLMIADLSLIQLDVEGYELPVLQGAIATIKSRQPVIVIEDNRKNCAGFLRQLGYEEVAQLGRKHVYLTNAAATELSELDERIRTGAIPR
jgi:FkbM family methyltransferase